MKTPEIIDVLDGRYKVTCDGVVISNLTGKILKPSLSHGYPMVNLTLIDESQNVYQKVYRIHRLMHMAFFPEHKGVINHKNGIKTDNRIDNLEVVSSSENNRHAYRIGLKKPVHLRGELSGSALLTNEQARLIRSMSNNGHSRKEIMSLFGISKNVVYRIINGKSYIER